VATGIAVRTMQAFLRNGAEMFIRSFAQSAISTQEFCDLGSGPDGSERMPSLVGNEVAIPSSAAMIHVHGSNSI